MECVQHRRIYFRGFSELRQIVEWLHTDLRCVGPPPPKDVCTASSHAALARCRETQYSLRPYVTHCPQHNTTMHFEWKSFMWTRADEVFLRRASAADVIVLNGGPHHLAGFPEHRWQLYWNVPRRFRPPPYWMRAFSHKTNRLFEHLAPLRRRSCVVWKTTNVGKRLSQGPTHHPSARGEMHDQMNGIARALAKDHDIPVLDLSDVTSVTRLAPLPTVPEGDIYHGYTHQLILPLFLRRLCQLCRR